jgi:hypothetical protein
MQMNADNTSLRDEKSARGAMEFHVGSADETLRWAMESVVAG